MLIVNTDEFTKRNLAKVGYAGQPARGRLAGALHGAPGRADDADRAARSRRPGWARRTPSARRTCSRSACCRGCTTGPPRAPSGSCGRSSAEARRSPRRTCWRSGPGWNYGETTEAFAVTYEVAPAPLRRGHLPEHHRQHRAGLRDRGRRPASAGCRCSSARTRSPRPRTSCTSCPSTRHFGVTHLPGRGRDRRHRRGARRVVRRRARRHHHVRPGRRAEVARRSAWR